MRVFSWWIKHRSSSCVCPPKQGLLTYIVKNNTHLFVWDCYTLTWKNSRRRRLMYYYNIIQNSRTKHNQSIYTIIPNITYRAGEYGRKHAWSDEFPQMMSKISTITNATAKTDRLTIMSFLWDSIRVSHRAAIGRRIKSNSVGWVIWAHHCIRVPRAIVI